MGIPEKDRLRKQKISKSHSKTFLGFLFTYRFITGIMFATKSDTDLNLKQLWIQFRKTKHLAETASECFTPGERVATCYPILSLQLKS